MEKLSHNQSGQSETEVVGSERDSDNSQRKVQLAPTADAAGITAVQRIDISSCSVDSSMTTNTLGPDGTWKTSEPADPIGNNCPELYNAHIFDLTLTFSSNVSQPKLIQP